MVFRRRPTRGVALAALVLCAAMPCPAAASGAGDAGPPALDRFLARMARVASLYEDQALRFTCDETISFSGRGTPPSVLRFKYVYLYSEKERALVDYRLPRGRLAGASEDRLERLALENYGLPAYILRAYSSIFVFHEGVQSRYRYTLEGEQKCQGRTAIRVRFEPVPPYMEGINDWFGSALVDRETHQLLHVETIEADEYDRHLLLQQSLEERGAAGAPTYRGTYTYSTYTIEFDVVRNGLRFPGRAMIARSDYEVRGGAGKGSVLEHPVYKVIQTYKRYRFFNVRTAEEIRRVVLAEE